MKYEDAWKKPLSELVSIINDLESQARKWYRADGSHYVFLTPEEVIFRRIEAAKELARLRSILDRHGIDPTTGERRWTDENNRAYAKLSGATINPTTGAQAPTTLADRMEARDKATSYARVPPRDTNRVVTSPVEAIPADPPEPRAVSQDEARDRADKSPRLSALLPELGCIADAYPYHRDAATGLANLVRQHGDFMSAIHPTITRSYVTKKMHPVVTPEQFDELLMKLLDDGTIEAFRVVMEPDVSRSAVPGVWRLGETIPDVLKDLRGRLFYRTYGREEIIYCVTPAEDSPL